MASFDEKMGRALTEEDRALLSAHGEPGYFKQAFGLFRGPQGWLMWVVNIAAAVSFIAGLYTLSRLLGAQEPVAAIQWGTSTVALFQVTMMCKGFMANRLEANRVMREVKRLELQVSSLRAGAL